MKIFDSPASTILVTNSEGTRYDIAGPFHRKLNWQSLAWVPTLLVQLIFRKAAPPYDEAMRLSLTGGDRNSVNAAMADQASRLHRPRGEPVFAF
jgi:hypothetical protein